MDISIRLTPADNNLRGCRRLLSDEGLYSASLKHCRSTAENYRRFVGYRKP